MTLKLLQLRHERCNEKHTFGSLEGGDHGSLITKATSDHVVPEVR
jgi:hypothetical protein